ncbi:hypothetical protein KUV95_17245 [Microbulbifer agarilyticus]|uniref:hypothetical protein n=1 Tax=Microbulbifer agarilyticus TaxID=260552 RepID=UPI001C98591D|nr:hypothetical protein [Microbulbifer agarilyticus]MBY6213292.1 hypothetical protein [Microbulbifer agarilyticus]
MEESSSVSVVFVISVIVGLVCTAAYLYCFLSLKKSNESSGLKHLAYFSGAFLVYFLANLFNYTIGPVAHLVGAGLGVEWVGEAEDLVYSITSIVAVTLFILGVRAAAEHVRA